MGAFIEKPQGFLVKGHKKFIRDYQEVILLGVKQGVFTGYNKTALKYKRWPQVGLHQMKCKIRL